MYSQVFQLLLLVDLNWSWLSFNYILHPGVLWPCWVSPLGCVRTKEVKRKTFIDGLVHRGSARLAEREMRLFMSIYDQCDQAMFGVFSLDQQLINPPQKFNSPGSSDSADGDILTIASLLTSPFLSPCLLHFAKWDSDRLVKQNAIDQGRY